MGSECKKKKTTMKTLVLLIFSFQGGSEVWTAVNQTVIASLAFHPNDRVLAIATYNCVYFWDWSKPEPFVSAATYNVKEKVKGLVLKN